MHGGDASFWQADAGRTSAPRPALDGHAEADVAIVGAGFTGLWTAYYLLERDPRLRIVVVERDTVGFGASGRNGGWCSGELAVSPARLAQTSSPEIARRTWQTIQSTVDEVGEVARRERIDCDFEKGGWVRWASNRAQWTRLRAEAAELAEFGFGEPEIRLLSPRETTQIVNVPGVHGALFSDHCAALHPAKLVHGLAAAVEARGATIHESTPAVSLERAAVTCTTGRVKAPVVVRATEAYTAGLRGHERSLLPVSSLMLATEPIPSALWDEIGLAGRPTFNDARRILFYGQRTADGRIAFGGRGVPYGFGSSTATDREHRHLQRRLHRTLVATFPMLEGIEVTHRWSGVLGVPRDWFPSVGYDRTSGEAWAGGYVGEGVAAANLAGRTLADLITGADSELVDLAWVDHRSPDWEPEPFRWLGTTATRWGSEVADRLEALDLPPQRWADALLDGMRATRPGRTDDHR